MPNWTITHIPTQAGKLAVVTGATGGLGLETALALAQAGAEVVLAGRNREKGQAAIQTIARTLPAAKARFELLDLASLKSVRLFAQEMVTKGAPLHLLVNNAGVMDLPTRRLTADGFEMQFGTNHLGHFALTGWLLPLLRRAGAARVVNVSSLAHRGGQIDFANLQAVCRNRVGGAAGGILRAEGSLRVKRASGAGVCSATSKGRSGGPEALGSIGETNRGTLA